jgi:hypothetical protein
VVQLQIFGIDQCRRYEGRRENGHGQRLAVLALRASLSTNSCCMSGRLIYSHDWQSTTGMSAAEHRSTAHSDLDISKSRRIFLIEILDNPMSHQQVVRPICDLCIRGRSTNQSDSSSPQRFFAKAAEAYSTTQENQIANYPVQRKRTKKICGPDMGITRARNTVAG